MPSFRATITRFLIRHLVGRRYRKAGRSIPQLRKLDEFLAQSQRPPKGTKVVPGPEDGPRGEWIQGAGAESDAAILYLHGGAFVTGSPATHRELAARISAAAGARVFSPGYRLAPEHPFPAAIEDTVKTYRWLLKQGYPPSNLVLGGESSGGGLALQALLTLNDEGLPMPKAAFFLSPVTDWSGFDGKSYSNRAASDPLLSLPQCRFTASMYVGNRPADTPLLRPTEMDLTGLPPIWIQVGEHEVLLSDAQRLAQRAAEAGVNVEFKVWPGLWHVFQFAARMVPEAEESIQELGEFVRKHLSH